MAVAVATWPAACKQTAPPAERTAAVQLAPMHMDQPSVHVPGPAPTLSGGKSVAQEATALVPAARCGECHGRMENEWRSSAHARADASPLFRSMRAAASSKICDRCHAPLRAFSTMDPVAAEGVTCDVCHTLSSVQVHRADGTGFVMHPEDNLRYGPLCDTQPHYFHRMACSVLHRDASFCAACHNWSLQLPSGESLTILPEYKEWRESTSPGTTFDCQICHMPSAHAEAAVGSRERTVRSHAFALRGGLRERALTAHVQISVLGGKAQISLSLINSGAGHAVPTGLPERRLQVGVLLLDARSQVIGHAEHSYGRVLVDADGHEVPFFSARRVQEDSRIGAGETKIVSFLLEVAAARQLRVYVNWRPFSHALIAQLGITPPPDEPMLSASIALPLPTKREGEPVLVKLKP